MTTTKPKKPRKATKPHYKGEDGTWTCAQGGDTYSVGVAETICEGIAEGRSLCTVLTDPKMPDYRTILRWLKNHEDFRYMYARAREDSADANADAISAVAEKCLLGLHDPAAARVAIDAMKWVAGRRLPRKYGEFSRNEISGPDGGPVELKHLCDEDRSKRIAELLAKRAQR